MCPDPFDYSGPVPNGSPPQNDFRARSGGILPLGAAPRPWPQVVRDAGGADEDGATLGGEEAPVETVSVLQPAAAVTGDDEPLAPDATATPVKEAPEPTLEPVPAEETAAEQAPADAPAVPAQPPTSGPPVEIGLSTPSTSAGETPGWRPRR